MLEGTLEGHVVQHPAQSGSVMKATYTALPARTPSPRQKKKKSISWNPLSQPTAGRETAEAPSNQGALLSAREHLLPVLAPQENPLSQLGQIQSSFQLLAPLNRVKGATWLWDRHTYPCDRDHSPAPTR